MTRSEALRAVCPFRVESIQVAYQANSSKPHSLNPQYAHCLACDCPKWIDERQSSGAYRCCRVDGVTVNHCQREQGVSCDACRLVCGHCGA